MGIQISKSNLWAFQWPETAICALWVQMSGRRDTQGHVSASQWGLSMESKIREDYSSSLHWAQVFILGKKRGYCIRLISLVSEITCSVPGQIEAVTLEMRGNYRYQEVDHVQCNGNWWWGRMGPEGWFELQTALHLKPLVLKRKGGRKKGRKRRGEIKWRRGK